MALSKSYLERISNKNRPIQGDRLCKRCGYNLIGLPSGTVCPECGTPFRVLSTQGRFVDNIVDAPLDFLRLLRIGGLMIAAAIGLGLASLGVGFLSNFTAVLAGLFASSIVWFAGIWLVTSNRPMTETTVKDAILDSQAMSWSCRFSQLSLLLGTGALMFAQALATPSTIFGGQLVLAWTGITLLLMFSFTLMPLGVYFGALSEWAGADGLSMKFRIVTTVVGLAGFLSMLAVVASILSSGFRGLGALVVLWSGIIVAVTLVVFLMLAIGLAGALRWAVVNAETRFESQARLAERASQNADRVAERQANASPTAEGHGGSWVDSGFIPLAGEDFDDTR